MSFLATNSIIHIFLALVELKTHKGKYNASKQGEKMKFSSDTDCCAKSLLTLGQTLGHEIPDRLLKFSNCIFSSAE